MLLLNLLRLTEPVSVGPGIMGTGYDFPPLRTGIDARRMQPAFHAVRPTHGAFHQATITLVFKIGGGAEPALKKMQVFAGKVVDNHDK